MRILVKTLLDIDEEDNTLKKTPRDIAKNLPRIRPAQNDCAVYRSRDLSLICILRLRGFKSLGVAILSNNQVRWAEFRNTKKLKETVNDYLLGLCPEATVLEEFRKSRAFLLDSTPVFKDMIDDRVDSQIQNGRKTL